MLFMATLDFNMNKSLKYRMFIVILLQFFSPMARFQSATLHTDQCEVGEPATHIDVQDEELIRTFCSESKYLFGSL